MAMIKLNPIISDIRKKMGGSVYSKWKGINYVRGLSSHTDRKSEEQVAVRTTFSKLVAAWKGLGAGAQKTWNVFSKKKNMTGFNAFIAKNFENMKADLALLISQPLEEEPVLCFSAQAGAAAGEIRCTFGTLLDEGKELTLFAQKKANGNGSGGTIQRYELGSAASPVTVSGLEPGTGYFVYAVITDGPYGTAKKVSPSVAAEAVAGA
jgi:hypothetical protein